MMDGQTPEPPRGTPGKRALGAMESAVRRVRESSGEPPLPPPARVPAPSDPPRHENPAQDRPPPDPPRQGPLPPREPGRPVVPPADQKAAAGQAPSAPHGAWGWWVQRERWLAGAVIALAILVAAAAVALAVSLSGGGPPAPVPPPVAAPAPGHQTHSPPSTTAPHRSTTTSPTTAPPTSTTVPAAPGGAPVIAALNPASGAAGQSIEVAGANFLSSDGQIIATFNGQVAPTSCPAQNACTITAPPIAGSSSAQVVITTSSGTSNPVTFTYS
jgi:IPT/TIG domain